MHPFAYSRASSEDDAARQLAERGATPLGGGTDLLARISHELESPDTVVDLPAIPQAREVTPLSDGGVRIGGAVRLAHLARHPFVRDRFPALGLACESVGTPALRTMGTIAGN